MAESWVYTKVIFLSVYIVSLKGQANQCDNPSLLIQFCHDMPYNYSSFPNIVYTNMVDSLTAEIEIQTFQPLVQTGCSDVLREFLCSVYFPDCKSNSGDVPPCREVCVAARSGCETLMTNFGYQWPTHLNCDQFPARGDTVCTYFESKGNIATTTTTKSESTTVSSKTEMTHVKTQASTTKLPQTTTSKMDKCSQSSRLAPFCDSMPYNTSSFPNSIIGIQTHMEAEMGINQFAPLVKVQCSDVLKEFLCSAYFPECDPNHGDIPPCRETCEYALAGCDAILKIFGFKWPQLLNCSKFPYRHSKRCAYYESKVIQNTTSATPTTTTTTTTTTLKPLFGLPDECKTNPQDVVFPNTLGHRTLEEALKNFQTFNFMLFTPSDCSPEITQYLCHVHFPQYTNNVKPCWEFCLRVRTKCLFELPVPWPKSFLCESFPARITSACWDSQ